MSFGPSTEIVVTPQDSVRLTQDDVRRLLEQPTLETKIDVLEKVSRHYSPDVLNENEMQVAEQIFRLLVQDSAIRVRHAMSESLQSNPHIPHDIALTLARDLEAVAVPMLTMSSVLKDDDLVDIVQNTEEIWRYIAIAQREELSETVSGSLVNTQLPDVIKEVLDNQSARISDKSFFQIAEQAKSDQNIVMSMMSRNSLPVAAVERLTHFVSDEMLRQLKDKCRVADREQLEAGARFAEEGTTLALLGASVDQSQTIKLVDQLFESGRLTSSLIINALCQGNLVFFESSLARLANIPLENARMLVSDSGRLGFRALYNKTQLPGTMYKAVRLLLDSVKAVLSEGARPGSHHFSNFVVRRMIESSEEEHVENLSYILAIIRQRQTQGA
ncbi:MAG: DUF2336 domain-containing protein [Rickettsiales bacterium]|nr:DUF2336 domain-containing protein [Rickettsiales bacterium]